MTVYKNIYLVMLVPTVMGLASCLKDAKPNIDPGASNNVVEFLNTSVPVSYTSVYPQWSNSILFNNDTGGFNINVDWAGAQAVSPQDITVTLTLDTAALSAFNANQATSFVVPPTDVFTFPSSITIKAGNEKAISRAVITAATDFDFTANYAIPLTISASSFGTISTNYGTAIFSFAGRNAYDGLYSLDELLVGWGAYGIADGISYSWPSNIQFLTSGQFTNTIQTTEEGYYMPAFTTGGGTTGFGATQVQFTFDGTSNAVTAVTNLQPDDGRGRAFAINPAVTNSRYDPTSGTIYAAYIMSQNGRPPQYVYDTLVFQGAR